MKSYLSLTNVQHPIMRSFLGIAACAFVISGCAGGTKLAQNSTGSVYLEEVSNWSYEASHPAVIDQLTITKIVKGLHRNDEATGSSRMPAGGSKPMRIFSDEDAEFLSPLLAQGLSKAKPDQLVGFRVSSSAGSGSEPTAGSIYVQQSAIHFTVSKGAGATTFMPESAARAEQAPPYAAGGRAGVTVQVIDYHALAQAPMPPALPMIAKTSAAPATGSRVAVPAAIATIEGEGPPEMQVQLNRAKDMLAKKETEIRVLRKESDWMKRELRDRDEEIRALKATVKVPPKKKKAEAYRTP